MAVKHAILGLLLKRRGYGYDLMQRLEDRLGPAWQLNPSTVYAALDQLELDGMIVGREIERSAPARTERRPKRVVYEVTEGGVREFEQWIGTPSPRLEPVRGELQLKIATARERDVPALLEAVEHAERIARARHEECREAAETPPLGPTGESPGAELAHTAALFRLEGELRWLRATWSALTERSPHPDGRGLLGLQR